MLSLPSISSYQVCVFKTCLCEFYSFPGFLLLLFFGRRFFFNQNILWQKHYFYFHVLLQLRLCFLTSFSVLSTFSSLKENIFLLWAGLGLEGKSGPSTPSVLNTLSGSAWEDYYSPFRSSSDVISCVRPLRLKLTSLFFFFPILRALTYRHLTTVV